ncbi:MAG TPA: protein kinase [Ktedonobacteraceae bacterium]
MPDIDQLSGGMLGDYRIERLLGQSQLGAAYLAVELARGSQAMVTTFHFPEGLAAQEREQFRARFSREGAALTRMVHAHIVPIYAFGEQQDYFYLVTAFVKEASLGQKLKQSTRLQPQQTLHVLKQLAAGLDYAHSQGVVHGMLSLANVVVDERLAASIAGFGLRTMLEIHGNGQSARPLGHLSSAQGAFLGSPEYIAPERVLGLACDARVDIYALGVMIFALLSGVQPFRAATPLDIALQRLQQPTPLVHALCPTLPEAFDLVIGRALERDPARRFTSAGELVAAFERVLNTQDLAQRVSAPAIGQIAIDAQLTMPPTVNWFDEQVTPSGRWQVVPSIGTEHMRALNSAPAVPPVLGPVYNTENMRDSLSASAVVSRARNLATSPQSAEIVRASNPPPAGAGIRAFPSESLATHSAAQGLPADAQRRVLPPQASGASLSGIDPFAWWSSHAGGRKQPPPAAPTPARRISLNLALPGSREHSQSDQQGRRKVLTLAVTGVVAAGVLSIGGLTFARLTQSVKQSSQRANAPATVSSINPAAQPTRASTTVPTHTGAVIGSTMLAVNKAQVFNNPTDNVSSLLIRLANGNFVACERTCTHKGVAVNYDSRSQMIICPAHGAIFDPKNGFSHVSGPGNGPLTRIVIHVNGDGTITSG